MDYNFSKLWSMQFWGFYKFKSFCEYASNKESQINYYKQIKSIFFDANGTSKVEVSQQLIDLHIAENESVLEMIKNQFIIFLFTSTTYFIFLCK